MTAAFTSVYSGLCGYFEANLSEVVYAAGSQILYKGRAAVLPFEGHESELDTSDPFRDAGGHIRTVYTGLDLPAQDSRFMLLDEMTEAMVLAATSASGSKWLATYCTSEMISKVLTLMVRTFDWYQTNHHVGQGHATHFITK